MVCRDSVWYLAIRLRTAQDTVLFDDSMLYNLKYGNMGATEEQAVGVARRVGLDVTAAKMPDGYETRVGERGMTISGG